MKLSNNNFYLETSLCGYERTLKEHVNCICEYFTQEVDYHAMTSFLLCQLQQFFLFYGKRLLKLKKW